MKLKCIMLSTLLLAGLTACVEPETNTEIKVIEVTEHAFKLNGESAVTIIVGHHGAPEFGFTVDKSDLKEGNLIESTSNNAKNLNVTASVGSIYYEQSKDHDTSASLKVLKLDKAQRTATLALSARLFNPELNDFKELKLNKVELTEINYDNLVKDNN